ncbi:MAG: hypothetical protein WC516_07020 [Patescibacteria group bacterium]
MKTIVINGMEIEVMVCLPSRRKASSNIQKARYQRNNSGAKWLAVDSGQIKMIK